MATKLVKMQQTINETGNEEPIASRQRKNDQLDEEGEYKG